MSRSFAAMSFRLLEPFIPPGSQARVETSRALRAARIVTFPEWYIAQSYAAAILGAAAGAVLGLVGMLALAPASAGFVLHALAMILGGALLFLLVRLFFLVLPRARSSARAKRIDQEFPSIVVLCYALARGGMGPLEIFRVIASERDTYGEISTEFAVLVRDTDILGHDVITALHNVASTTPSAQFKGFLEGLVTILNSGADPRDYFKSQSEGQADRAEISMATELEQAGMLAETYVSSFLVLPLLLLVVLSGLSALGGGQEAYIPLVVYGIIPLGTFIYLMLVETMMPPITAIENHVRAARGDDFGLAMHPEGFEHLPAPWEKPVEKGKMTFRELLGFVRQRSWAFVQGLRERLLLRPGDAIEISGIAALILLLAGLLYVWTSDGSLHGFVVGATGVFVVAAAVAFLPVAVFHELRLRRARVIESELPHALSKLAGFNERGIGLLQSFQILGNSSGDDPLARELRAVERDVSWNGNLAAALRRLRERVRTRRTTKLAVLLERASQATPHLKEVLGIAAREEMAAEGLRVRKRQSMLTYVIVIYLVFAVFLYVIFTVARLFYGEASFALAAGPNAGDATAVGAGLAPQDAQVLFLHAVVLQGICSGMVAGRLGEAHVLSGLKHAAILGTLAWLVFRLGVIS